jgi:hypothetical protein
MALLPVSRLPKSPYFGSCLEVRSPIGKTPDYAPAQETPAFDQQAENYQVVVA